MYKIVLVFMVAVAASLQGANAAHKNCFIGSSSAVGTNATSQFCSSGTCATYTGSAMLNGTRFNGTIHTCGDNMTCSSTTCGNLTLVDAIGALSGLGGIICNKVECCTGSECNSPFGPTCYTGSNSDTNRFGPLKLTQCQKEQECVKYVGYKMMNGTQVGTTVMGCADPGVCSNPSCMNPMNAALNHTCTEVKCCNSSYCNYPSSLYCSSGIASSANGASITNKLCKLHQKCATYTGAAIVSGQTVQGVVVGCSDPDKCTDATCMDNAVLNQLNIENNINITSCSSVKCCSSSSNCNHPRNTISLGPQCYTGFSSLNNSTYNKVICPENHICYQSQSSIIHNGTSIEGSLSGCISNSSCQANATCPTVAQKAELSARLQVTVGDCKEGGAGCCNTFNCNYPRFIGPTCYAGILGMGQVASETLQTIQCAGGQKCYSYSGFATINGTTAPGSVHGCAHVSHCPANNTGCPSSQVIDQIALQFGASSHACFPESLGCCNTDRCNVPKFKQIQCHVGFVDMQNTAPSFGLQSVWCPMGHVCAKYHGDAVINGTMVTGYLTACRPQFLCAFGCPANLELTELTTKFGADSLTCKNATCCNTTNCNLPTPACPGNQVYSMCASCDRTCANMNQPVVCIQVCQQKCTCPLGLVLNGDMCVDATQCPVAPVMNITCPSVSPNACTNELKSGFICDFLKWRLSLNHWLQKFEQWRVSNGYTSTLPTPSCPNFNVQCNDATKLKYTTDIYRCNIPYCTDGKYKTGPSIQVWREHQKHWNILYTRWTASNTDSCNGQT